MSIIEKHYNKQGKCMLEIADNQLIGRDKW